MSLQVAADVLDKLFNASAHANASFEVMLLANISSFAQRGRHLASLAG